MDGSAQRTTARAARRTGRLRGAARALALAALLALAGCSGAAPTQRLHHGPDPLGTARIDLKPGPADAVLTQRGDLTRLGWDSTETALTVASVSSGRFGKRAAFPVDGRIYAQPLYAPGLLVDGTRHDLVLAATEHDSVYAFDADATGPAAVPLWHTSLIQPGARTFRAADDRVAKDRLCDSIAPEVGITSTPVVDWATLTVYVMALDVEHGVMTYRIHALSLLTGRELRPSTVVTAGGPGTGLDAAHGQVTFKASDEQQRMGLTEVAGTVYAGFSSWCGLTPYHGWVLGYDAATLKRDVVYDDSPDSWGGGLWESESGISVDGHGHLYLVTGNGPFDLDRGGADAGDTLLEVEPDDGTLVTVDSFTPFDQQCRAEHDQDLGSGSPLMVPGEHELLLSSKTGAVYLLDEADLGGYRTVANPCPNRARTDVDRIKQELTLGTVPGGMWGTWGYWSDGATQYVYGSGAQGELTQWRLNPGGTLAPVPVAHAPEPFAYPGSIPVVSSDGTRPGTGVLWTVDQTHGAVLRAYDAADISRQIWTSAQDPARDGLEPGSFDHFTVPTTADGLVFVGDQSRLEVYGLLRG
ncbi:hypothetical protein [Streptacidiphilus sp. P02-A3a]|uniref:hypothetical protein n=1 Tax=Streptacidiphilus sp. P02-A3a TaxID=2704468 RepID=UPI0015FE018C|nr:hypothetical protein [Streptacidiphilus sp. P02-A3a]QMU69427.1 hypothetical protein GXP74_15445 [Streptacidiphilus sp. P02-A3a]